MLLSQELEMGHAVEGQKTSKELPESAALPTSRVSRDGDFLIYRVATPMFPSISGVSDEPMYSARQVNPGLAVQQ